MGEVMGAYEWPQLIVVIFFAASVLLAILLIVGDALGFRDVYKGRDVPNNPERKE